MNKIKPMLPCPSIKEQVAFYENLGFKTIHISNRPNPYAVVRYGELEMHFYGSKKTLPNENPSMCYLEVDDVIHVYEEFTSGLKKKLGRIPRSGIPRISKLKDLAEDRRFMITDMGGNTLFIGTPNSEQSDPAFFRTIESIEHAKNFAILYDLMYSKEDTHSAINMLEKFFPADLSSLDVGESDFAKVLLVALDIQLQRNQIIDQSINDKLKELVNACEIQSSDWQKIKQKYDDIVNGE